MPKSKPSGKKSPASKQNKNENESESIKTIQVNLKIVPKLTWLSPFSPTGCPFPEAKESQYLIKWEGYPSEDNSYERENRIIFFTDVLDYWINISANSNLSAMDEKIMHGTFLYHSLQATYGRFMFTKTVPTRNRIIKDNPCWEFRYMPWIFDPCSAIQAHYSHQLRTLNGLFPDFPFFEVYNEFDSALPLPLVRYAFDDFLSPGDPELERDENNENLLSEDCLYAYEINQPMPVNERDTYSNNLIRNAKLSIFFQTNKAFLRRKEPVHMVVIRREERRWEVISRGPLSPDTQIMPIGGKVYLQTAKSQLSLQFTIIRKTVAKSVIEDYGELLGFPFFIELDDGYCLDRRETSDFSQYITQSCDPNCFVKREYVNGKAKLYIYTKRSVVPGETLTLDWFSHYADENYEQHETLVDMYVDHVLCSCGARKCRSVLWQRSSPSISRKRKLKQNKVMEKFAGLILV